VFQFAEQPLHGADIRWDYAPRRGIRVGGTQQFVAVVSPGGASQSVAWSLAGPGCSGASCGTIDATGKYTVPATVPAGNGVTVTARSVVDSTKSASVTVGIMGETLSVSPDSVEFGNQMVNTTSAPRLVTWTNTGSSTPQPIDLELSGDNGWQDFAFTDDCPSMLAVGASCTINITFTASVTGVRVAYMGINGISDYSFVTLGGTGTS
jgi:hypothetical protein